MTTGAPAAEAEGREPDDAGGLRGRGGWHLVAFLAALALVLAMTIDWYTTEQGEEFRRVEQVNRDREDSQRLDSEDVERAAQAAENEERNAFQADAFIDRLILLACLAAFVAAVATAFLRSMRRRAEPPWNPSALATVAGILATLLILYRMIQPPGFNEAAVVKPGVPIALAAVGILTVAARLATLIEREERLGPVAVAAAEAEAAPRRRGRGRRSASVSSVTPVSLASPEAEAAPRRRGRGRRSRQEPAPGLAQPLAAPEAAQGSARSATPGPAPGSEWPAVPDSARPAAPGPAQGSDRPAESGSAWPPAAAAGPPAPEPERAPGSLWAPPPRDPESAAGAAGDPFGPAEDPSAEAREARRRAREQARAARSGLGGDADSERREDHAVELSFDADPPDPTRRADTPPEPPPAGPPTER
ncbi:MAG TPA: hypothetical protein VF517_10050 [Thermoleophilaceae bacterium]